MPLLSCVFRSSMSIEIQGVNVSQHSREKINEIAVLRGMAFSAVVLQHAIAHFSIVQEVRLEDGVLMSILLLLSKFAVPAFAFITGMLLLYNDREPGADVGYGAFLRKRLSGVIIPYLLWSVIYQIANGAIPLTNWNLAALTDSVVKLFTGKSSYHLWYIIMIIQFYLVYPLFLKGYRAITASISERWRLSVLAGAGLLYIALMYAVWPMQQLLSGTNIPVVTAMFTTLADRNILYFIFYFVLGAAAGSHMHRWTEWARRLQWVYWPAIAVITGYLLYTLTGSFQQGQELVIRFHSVSLLRPLMALYCILLVLAAYRVALMVVNYSERMTRWWSVLGDLSYGSYLIHALMLRVTYVPDESLLTSLPVVVRMLLSFVLALVLSTAATWLLAQLPGGRWLTGMKLRRRSEHRYKGTGVPPRAPDRSMVP